MMIVCVFELAVDWNWYVFRVGIQNVIVCEWIGNETKGIGQVNEEESEC